MHDIPAVRAVLLIAALLAAAVSVDVPPEASFVLKLAGLGSLLFTAVSVGIDRRGDHARAALYGSLAGACFAVVLLGLLAIRELLL